MLSWYRVYDSSFDIDDTDDPNHIDNDDYDVPQSMVAALVGMMRYYDSVDVDDSSYYQNTLLSHNPFLEKDDIGTIGSLLLLLLSW